MDPSSTGSSDQLRSGCRDRPRRVPSGKFSSQGNALSITLVLVPLFFAPYQLPLRKLARYCL